MYPNLKAEIFRQGMNFTEFATNVLGIAPSQFSSKYTGRIPFNQGEIEKTLNFFKLPYEYIFLRKV